MQHRSSFGDFEVVIGTRNARITMGHPLVNKCYFGFITNFLECFFVTLFAVAVAIFSAYIGKRLASKD